MPLMLTFLSSESLKLQLEKFIPSRDIFSMLIPLKSLFTIFNKTFVYKYNALDDSLINLVQMLDNKDIK